MASIGFWRSKITSDWRENTSYPWWLLWGLDRSWQAYLFYIINIRPKKINPSLAYDLYPLLRTEEWLTKFEGHVIYRETRAQELVDLALVSPQQHLVPPNKYVGRDRH